MAFLINNRKPTVTGRQFTSGILISLALAPINSAADAGASCGNRMNMLRQLLVGGGVSAVNMAIHALAMTFVIHRYSTDEPEGQCGVVNVSDANHDRDGYGDYGCTSIEVVVWALAYAIVGAVPAAGGGSKIYFAFVNYMTLGYGDIVPVERWRLLGPMTALNGVLLIGWSTAVIFEVLRWVDSPLEPWTTKCHRTMRMSGDGLS